MNGNQTVLDLKEKERILLGRMNSIQQDLEAIRRVIHLCHNGQESAEEFPIIKIQGHGPVEAIRRLFDEAPNKKWSPPEIKERLEMLRSENKLVSSAKRMYGTVHTALAGLERAGHVRRCKNIKGRSDTYQKVIKEESASTTDK